MIFNFKETRGMLACSGQPTEEQFVAIAAESYKVVINLGLAGTKYALPDEAGLVKRLDMTYHHVPVQFEEPKRSQLLEFSSLMNRHENEKILVHCAANYRASAFTGLYLFSKSEFDENALYAFIGSVWQPDAIWQQFIAEGVALLQRP